MVGFLSEVNRFKIKTANWSERVRKGQSMDLAPGHLKELLHGLCKLPRALYYFLSRGFDLVLRTIQTIRG